MENINFAEAMKMIQKAAEENKILVVASGHASSNNREAKKTTVKENYVSWPGFTLWLEKDYTYSYEQLPGSDRPNPEAFIKIKDEPYNRITIVYIWPR